MFANYGPVQVSSNFAKEEVVRDLLFVGAFVNYAKQ